MSNLVIEPVTVKLGQELWHVTPRSTCQEIRKRGGLVPLNWILEGDHGQAKSSNVTGLDAARGAKDYKSDDQHQEELKNMYDDCVRDAKSVTDKELVGMIWRRYASKKLGRKWDFVYGTSNRTSAWGYASRYVEKKIAEMKDLFMLRWQAAGEVYYIDEEDKESVKTFTSIPVERLYIASLADFRSEMQSEFDKLVFEPLGKTKMI